MRSWRRRYKTMAVEEFAPHKITNASAQFFGTDGTQEPGTPFTCIGTVEGETVLKELVKMCEGVEVDKKVKAEKHELTVSAHVPVSIMRKIFGFSNENLKQGVYSYGTKSKGQRFVFTADVIDEFEEVTKLIAFPNCRTNSGFTFTIENGADEVAEMEVSLAAYPDTQGELYYEAIVAELAVDSTVPDTWHTTFDRTLVEEVPAP